MVGDVAGCPVAGGLISSTLKLDNAQPLSDGGESARATNNCDEDLFG